MDPTKLRETTNGIEDEQRRNDVAFSYGTGDGISHGSLDGYGLRLTPSHDGAAFTDTGGLGFSNTPVLVSRGSTTKGSKGPLVCHVEGCQRDLSLEKKYYKRYRVCMEHLKMNAIYVDGELQRFCQQCGRFHELSKFDGDKRNCRERLSQHNRRRRKSKRESGGSDGSWDDYSHDTSSGKTTKSRRSKRIVQESVSMWGTHSAFDGPHGISSEEQNALGSVGMEMLQGIPVAGTGSSGIHPFADGLPMGAESQSSAAERESLYNMVMHNVHSMTSSMHDKPITNDKVPTTGLAWTLPFDKPCDAGAMSGGESLHNLTALLQVPDITHPSESTEGKTSPSTNVPTTAVNSSMGILQSVCVSSPGNMNTVPMFVFPSTSAPHQLSAVAIIPSTTSSCSTIVPVPWQGSNQQQGFSQGSLPLETSAPMTTTSSIPEIAPLVSFALSASGIAPGTGSNAYQSSISPNQLAHFQMLMARQISMSQNPDVAVSQPMVDITKMERHSEPHDLDEASK